MTERTASKIRSGRSDQRSRVRQWVSTEKSNPSSSRANPQATFQPFLVEPKCRVVLADLTTSDRHLVNLIGTIGDTKGTDMGVHVR